MLSSAESIVIFPPSTVKAIPALSALALPVSLLDELLVFEEFAHGPFGNFQHEWLHSASPS